MEFKNECPRIGKEFLRLCAIPADANKQVISVPTIDTSRCCSMNCPVYANALKKSLNLLNAYNKTYHSAEEKEKELARLVKEELEGTCVTLKQSGLEPFCEKGAVVMQEKVKYDYEYTISIGKPRKLSKTQIQLALLYHFLADKYGIIKSVDERDLAAKLDCDVKTVKLATDALKDMGIIAHSYLGDYKQVIALLDYKKYYAPAKNGGVGYIYMAENMLDVILACKDVNELRAHLRMLLIDDTTNMHVDNDNKAAIVEGLDKVLDRKNSRISINDARRYLPKYFSISKLTNTFAAAKTAFETFITENGIEFKLKDAFNGKKKVAETFVATVDAVKELTSQLDFDLNKKEIEDTAKLTQEFGLDLVEEGLSSITKTICNEVKVKVENLKSLCNEYGDKLEANYSEQDNEVFSELVSLLSGEISVDEAELLKVRHPEAIAKGKAAIDNFGAYLRTVIERTIYKRKSCCLA